MHISLYIDKSYRASLRIKVPPVLGETVGKIEPYQVIFHEGEYFISPVFIFKNQGKFFEFFDIPDSYREIYDHSECREFCSSCDGWSEFIRWATNNPVEYTRGLKRASRYALIFLLDLIDRLEVLDNVVLVSARLPKVVSLSEAITNALQSDELSLRVGDKVYKLSVVSVDDYTGMAKELANKVKEVISDLENVYRTRLKYEVDKYKKIINELKNKTVPMPPITFDLIKEGLQMMYHDRYYHFILPISFTYTYVYRRDKLYMLKEKWRYRFNGHVKFICRLDYPYFVIEDIELLRRSYRGYRGPHSNPGICLGDMKDLIGYRFIDLHELLAIRDRLANLLQYINLSSCFEIWNPRTLRYALYEKFDEITVPVEEGEVFSSEDEFYTGG